MTKCDSKVRWRSWRRKEKRKMESLRQKAEKIVIKQQHKKPRRRKARRQQFPKFREWKADVMLWGKNAESLFRWKARQKSYTDYKNHLIHVQPRNGRDKIAITLHLKAWKLLLLRNYLAKLMLSTRLRVCAYVCEVLISERYTHKGRKAASTKSSTLDLAHYCSLQAS